MKYEEARKLMKPGDLIGFSGNSLVSFIIQKVTNSDISHVGVILQTQITDSGSLVNQLIESTTLGKGFAGVKISRMSDHIRDYDGKIYWYALNEESRNLLDQRKMFDFLLSQKGKSYDCPQAILSALDLLPDSREDFDLIYCSELSSAGYEAGTLIKNVNCSEITPADQVAMNLFCLREELT